MNRIAEIDPDILVFLSYALSSREIRVINLGNGKLRALIEMAGAGAVLVGLVFVGMELK